MLYDLQQFEVVLSDRGFFPGKPFLKLIAGDASDRKFYRLCNDSQTAICMQFPKWEGGYGGDPLSWLSMHEALVKMGLPVPQIWQIDEKNCCIWTEDLGEIFLGSSLHHQNLMKTDRESFEYYREALSLLVKAQYPNVCVEHIAKKRHFDFEKLYFEMNFFIKHFLNGFLNLNVEKENVEWQPFLEEIELLCKKIAKFERVLCHRDYHVRNIMLKDRQLFWIDFQDARMGPCSYDVVSLVRDSYVNMEWEVRFELFAHYLHEMNLARDRFSLPQILEKDFYQEALFMGLQRNLKAIGSFAYLATLKGKPSYLHYVFQTLHILAAVEAQKYNNFNLVDVFPNTFQLIFDLLHGKFAERLKIKIEEHS